METWNRRAFAAASGIDLDFVQDNQSLSVSTGTVRGLHFQSPPCAQDKLIRVLAGTILDVAVDIRQGSPSFGRWVAAELSAKNRQQLLVPIGFAHGFVTLEPDTIVAYKVSNHYSKENDLGIRWNDPDIAVDWPLPPSGAVLSEKDAALPFLRDISPLFTWRAAL
ncbi:dTDP-4-dehydrorhamnose 3,5-epimerase [Magnetospirillum molischianum DSM 120]|uniref:dTDP-4-dehydrorhamnose 3,5-epimerase n=2 Tax=Magnetospirillum molischianum TaxID=1083 RepID=H8FS29_MAGML|nr:dTDP-4-dehydrorhamnose 3,5-epimerase [Magnetospirillum molischianum DSM 120]